MQTPLKHICTAWVLSGLRPAWMQASNVMVLLLCTCIYFHP